MFDQRKKLKEEYHGLDGKKIGNLAKNGVEVNHVINVPIFGYTGDTTLQGVIRHSSFTDCQILVMECTYIGLDENDSIEECTKRGHVHLDQIIAQWKLFKNEYIVLCHFSRRYKREQIIEKVEQANKINQNGPILIPFI